MERQELLRRLLEETYAEELALVDWLDEAERERAGTFAEWSARDILAHSAAWKASLAGELAAAARGEPSGRPPDFDFEAENARIFQEHEGKGWPEILGVVEGAQRSLTAELAALSEEDLGRPDVVPWQNERPVWRLFAGNGVMHPLLHLADAYRTIGAAGQAAEMIAALGDPLAGLDDEPGWQGTVRYNQACGEALMGRSEAALASLRTALTLNPELIPWSREDSDLASLRDLPDYEALYDALE